MKPEEVLARRLRAEIEDELGGLAVLAREFADRPRTDDSYAMRARGSILHDFYSAIERVFTRIARELNGGIPQGEQWHRQLLDDMRLDIPEVRPAVIEGSLAKVLGEYLGFRHLFRNVYGSVLDVARVTPLEDRLPDTLATFERQVRAFLSWMIEPSGRCHP